MTAIVQAQRYATCQGWPVLPLRPCSKLPATRHGVHDATVYLDAIAAWSPAANVGIATGGGVVVLDVDLGAVDGAEVLHELEQRHERLPATVTALTPSGGAHLYFSCDRPIPCSVARLGPGLDVRGEGGYVVAPDSTIAGRAYEWEIDPDELELAPLPAWLEQLLTGGNERRVQPAQDWRQLVRAGVSAGSRNQRCAALCGHLLRRHVDPFVALELLLAWNSQRNRPPLSDDEVARTVDSIAGRELSRWQT